jgi:hypothetical protein
MSDIVNWNPRWYQAGESLWSVANKLAWAASASVADVLAILAGVVKRCREAWLFPSMEQARVLCGHLGLSVEVAKGQLFADICGMPKLQEREHWQIGIRFCPICLEGFVHRTHFQDRRVTHCLAHGVPLQEGCPACGAHLDPMCKQAWCCSYCSTVLSIPGNSWPSQFRQGPSQQVLQGPWTAPDQSPVWRCPPTRRRLGELAYEEHSAIWSVYLGTHAGCARRELDCINAFAMPVRFKCPVACAAVMTATMLGIAPQFVSGAWVDPRPRAALALGILESTLLWEVPSAELQTRVRDMTRLWVLEAIEAFVAAALLGKEVAHWHPSLSLAASKSHSRIYERLEQAATAADSFCGFKAPSASRNVKSLG